MISRRRPTWSRSSCWRHTAGLTGWLGTLSFLLSGGRNSMTLPGQDGPAPMAIFELLDYIVIEVCSCHHYSECLNEKAPALSSPSYVRTLCTESKASVAHAAIWNHNIFETHICKLFLYCNMSPLCSYIAMYRVFVYLHFGKSKTWQ